VEVADLLHSRGDESRADVATGRNASADGHLLKALFDANPVPMALTSLHGNRVLAMNERASDIFGVPAGRR
jgi:hypothetical protein